MRIMKLRLRSGISVLLILLFALMLAVPAFAAVTVTPGDDFSVAAKAAILVELNSDSVLYAQDADEKIYPASLTKIMTCLLALENGNLDDTVTVSATALEESRILMLPADELRRLIASEVAVAAAVTRAMARH